MREVRPYGAPSAWAADELRTQLMFQRIRVEHDAGVTEGIFDNARGTDVEVIDYAGQLQVIPGSTISAFEFIRTADRPI